MKKQAFVLLPSCILILVFLYAGLTKWLKYKVFLKELYNQVFPAWAVQPIAWIFPAAELISAILLMTDRTRLWGFRLATALMAIFTAYVAFVVLHVFERVPCSCGGILGKLQWGPHLVFNLICLAVAITGWVLEKKTTKLQNTRKATALPA